MPRWLNKRRMKKQALDAKLCEALGETLSSHSYALELCVLQNGILFFFNWIASWKLFKALFLYFPYKYSD